MNGNLIYDFYFRNKKNDYFSQDALMKVLNIYNYIFGF